MVASPTRRSVDTLEPLAARLGLRVDIDDRLCPQWRETPLVELLDHPRPRGTVVCSHGEAMRPLLAELHRRGALVVGDEPDDRLLRKGAGVGVGL